MRTLSIIVPVYNEEKIVANLLQKVNKQKFQGWKKEIILVDDGSIDNSINIIKPLKSKIPNLKLYQQKHQGKGMALRKGIKVAKGDVIVFQDADMEYAPSDLPKLLKEFNDNQTQVVYGSRSLKPKHSGYPVYILEAWLLTKILNIFYGTKLTDLYTGYKLCRRQVVQSLKLESSGFEIEAELTIKLIKKGFAIKELPINYYPRTIAEGKKINAWDGIIGLWTIVKGLVR